MSKKLKYLSIVLVAILVLTGCEFKIGKQSKKDAKTQLTEAIEKTSKIENANVKADIKLTATQEGSTMEISANVAGDVYEVNDNMSAHLNAKVTALGQAQDTEMYMMTKDNKLYTYTKDKEGWTYTTSDSAEKEDLDLDELKEEINKAKEIKEVDSDKKGYTKLSVTIGKEEINKALSDEDVKKVTSNQSIALSNDMTFYVYLKDGYVSIIDMDLSNTAKDLLSSFGLGNAEVKANIYIELSNIGKVKEITVPQEVISNAKLATDTTVAPSLMG